MAAAGPREIYRERLAAREAEVTAGERRLRRLANLRLLVFAGLLVAVWYLFDGARGAGYATAGGLGLFVYLMRRHAVRIREQRLSEALVDVNRRGLARLEGAWVRTFGDRGEEFSSDAHPYAGDLDIFGTASLFQWLSAASTQEGRRRLAAWLAGTPPDVGEIRARQQAVRDLAPRLDWRQAFEASGRAGDRPLRDPAEFSRWLADPEPSFGPVGTAVYRTMPLVTAGLFVLTRIGPGWDRWLMLALVAQFFLFLGSYRRNFRVIEGLRVFRQDLTAFRRLFELAEREDFAAPRLRELQARLGRGAEPASAATRRLTVINDWLDVHRNPLVHVILNVLVLWDFQFLLALRTWKRRHAAALPAWVDAVAELEALGSLAVPAWEQPDWCDPDVEAAGEPESEDGGGAYFEADAMGHPLISAEARVVNDFCIDRGGTVVLVTGSNMSGKSTFLRTVGINHVLAWAGGPVCARRMRCRVLSLATSMRIRDDLEQHISSFYAELLRVKMIVEKARAGEPLLFLIDEIFRGTNSVDRHTGAEQVLQRLHELGATGLVSTHDLDVADRLAKRNASFPIYHFTEYYEGDTLRFDYRLHPGVSTTRNAMALMRIVGVLPPEGKS